MEAGDPYVRDRFAEVERRLQRAEDDLDLLQDIKTEMRLLRQAVNRWATLTFSIGATVLAAAAIVLLLRGPG